MAKIYLTNNRKKEPEFMGAFSKVCRASKHKFEAINTLDLAFRYNRNSNLTTIYYKNRELKLNKDDSFFIRAWFPSEDATVLLCLILKQEKINFSDARINTKHEIRTSKLSQTFQLANQGCPSPSTWVVSKQSFPYNKNKIIKDLKFPIIVKKRGALGLSVWKCDDELKLINKINEVHNKNSKELVICQEYIPNNSDIRVIVYKNEILVAIKRSSSDNFLNNLSQGAKAEKIELTSKEKKLALKATKTIGLDLAGVDIVRTDKESLIFEVNKAPDICAFEPASGFNLSQKIAEMFLKK